MIFSHSFRMLAQEGHLASTSLLGGFESLNKVNYDQPGTVYSALFQMTIGLERIMKIAWILNFRLRHDLQNPSDAQLRQLGHSVTNLYRALEGISDTYDIGDGWFESGSLHDDVLAFMAEYAKGSRYYNIDQLVAGRPNPDPLVRWFNLHLRIADGALSHSKREGIMDRARLHCERLGLLGWEMGPRGQYDLTIDVTYQLEVTRQTRGHCVWIFIELLRPIYSLIERLVRELHELEQAKGIGNPDVPYMYEFFPFCLGDRQTVVRRKAWTTLFVISGRV
ncbi:hypothetical protein J2S28_004987 [Rhizobium sp. SLBN-94]|jgi:hypothetical protein|nr:hypothetical protein [Rhizobium sp. SLBN-94]